MTTSNEVIDLVDSDNEEEESHPPNDEAEDAVVLVKTVKKTTQCVAPTLETTGRVEKSRPKQVSNPYIKDVSKPARKRFRTVRTADTSGANVDVDVSCATSNVMVKIDSDGSDNGQATPGILQPKCDWIHSNNTCRIVQFIGQKDQWSCGYRNLQMLLSAVLPQLPEDHLFHTKYPRRSDQITIPSINQIQSVIERAWKDGFDSDGATHFHHKLRGKRCFIGAVEVYTALTFWGIDPTIVQFIRCRESREQLPIFVKAYFAKSLGRGACPFCSAKNTVAATNSATEWANRLLTSAPSDALHPGNVKCRCPLMPLYFQWEGHSVTIVGVEGSTDELLVYNPQHKYGPTRMQISALLVQDTQILMVTSFRSLSSSERSMKKVIREFPTANLPAVMNKIRSG
jgi:Peptidase family C78